MFCINKDADLTPELLQKMFNEFFLVNRPKLQKYKDYYDGKQNILKKVYADANKPCNRTVTNFCSDIADSYDGYLASPGYISYSSESDIDDIMEVLDYNDYQAEDCDFMLDLMIYGVAAELMYVDDEAKCRFKLIDPRTCFGIFDNTLNGDLMYFVRWYKANDWDDSDLYNVDVYGDAVIKHYTMNGTSGFLQDAQFVQEEPNYFAQCPANIAMLKDEKSIFDCIMSGQDTYNELLAGEVDDYSAFVDAFLALIGCDAESEDIEQMRESRVLILPDGASAQWLTKQSTESGVESMLDRVQANIYRIAKCPDFSAESFVGGVSSGIAIRYRLTGMETRAAKVESIFKKALQRRIEIICGFSALKIGEEVFRDINITFKRNIPSDNNDLINTINALRGVVSDETLLGMIPQVDDVAEELERVEAQKQKNMELYGFGSGSEDEGDDEE